MNAGVEWIIDAHEFEATCLAGLPGLERLRSLFDFIIAELDLHPLHEPYWHVFTGAEGITGLVALSESHLACHSYPERGYLSINLYTCRTRPAPDWEELLSRLVGSCRVQVRQIERGTVGEEAESANGQELLPLPKRSDPAPALPTQEPAAPLASKIARAHEAHAEQAQSAHEDRRP